MRRLVSRTATTVSLIALLVALLAVAAPSANGDSGDGASARRKALARAAARKKAALAEPATPRRKAPAILTAPGRVTVVSTAPVGSKDPVRPSLRILMLMESPIRLEGGPNVRTNWYWNVRQGDAIRIAESGNIYTIYGPMDIKAGNPERLLNNVSVPLKMDFKDGRGMIEYEYLILTNSRDDDRDGRVDQGWYDGMGFDEVDNDGDGLVDEATIGPPFDFDGDGTLDANYAELEQESWLAPDGPGRTVDAAYSIIRKAEPTPIRRAIPTVKPKSSK